MESSEQKEPETPATVAAVVGMPAERVQLSKRWRRGPLPSNAPLHARKRQAALLKLGRQARL